MPKSLSRGLLEDLVNFLMGRQKQKRGTVEGMLLRLLSMLYQCLLDWSTRLEPRYFSAGTQVLLMKLVLILFLSNDRILVVTDLLR